MSEFMMAVDKTKKKHKKDKKRRFSAPLTPDDAKVQRVEGMTSTSDRKKKKSGIRTKLLINNQWVNARTGRTFETLNPATGEKICDVQEGGKEDIDAAVAAARAALPGWRKVAPREKGKMLFKLADLMEANRDALANLESLDNGKPRSEAYNVDLNLSINTIRYYAGYADKNHGRVIPMDPPNFTYCVREPVGVVGQIIPWNFPIAMAAWKLGPALCCGNCLVLKPAENTPLTALAIGQLCIEAGFPPGVVNVVNGFGHTAGEALANHPDIDKIAFTGSTKIGKHIGEIAGRNLKRCTLELGGKSPLFICEDADIEAAIKTAHLGLFLNQGQCCCASSRLFVHEKIYDRFVERCVQEARNRRTGDPFEGATTQGPQISEVQMNQILNFIESGKREGARLLCGGKRAGNRGYFVEATVFADVQDHMTIAKEEIFGPVMSIIKFSDLGEAIKRGNATRYGLACGVFSKDISKCMKVAQEVNAGTIWINTYDVLHEAAPFGGFKESGVGRELGACGLDAYCEWKTVTMDTSVGGGPDFPRF